jgi:DNA topoisomerase-3
LAKVISVCSKELTKYKPFPLNTIETTKLISRRLKISPHVTMSIMEKLYQRGYLSYPRTETTVYNKTINLKELVVKLKGSEAFGFFAEKLLSGDMWRGPRNGKHDDKSHPPIHPVKLAH